MIFSERDSRSRSLYVVVRPSVCLSIVCNVRAPYSGYWNFRQYFYIIRKTIYPSFLKRRIWLVGGRPLLREIYSQPTPVGAKAPIFNRYSPVAPQPRFIGKHVVDFLLYSVNWTFLAKKCYGWGAVSEYRLKIGDYR